MLRCLPAPLSLVVLLLLANLALAQPCLDAELNQIFVTGPPAVGAPPFAGMIGGGDIDDVSAGANRLDVPVAAGRVGATTVYAAIVSQFDPAPPGERTGVQGWSLACVVTGDIQLITATTTGTAARDLMTSGSGGFEKTEPFHAETDEGPVITSAMVLSFREPLVLPIEGTATILAIEIEAPGPQPDAPSAAHVGGIRWRDGVGYNPVVNTITVNGASAQPCRRQEVTIAFVHGGGTPHRRGDTNGDGRVDIADPIWLLQQLFRKGPPTRCADAADANDDGILDVADAAFGIGYNFFGGAPSPPPFPECGDDPTDDALECDEYPSCP